MAMIVADSLENATHAASLFELNYEIRTTHLSARDVVDRPAEPDEKDGQIRHGSYLPDHFVKLEEEDRGCMSGVWSGSTRLSALVVARADS